MSANKILVSGATGKIGEALVHLLKEKAAVTVIVRDVEKAKKLFGDKVQYAKGDFNEHASFEAAFKAGGFHRFFLLSFRQDLEGAVAHLAKAHGVKQIVKISCIEASVGAEPGSILHGHGAAEAEVLKAGVPTVFLRPHDFMQNLLTSAATIKQGKVFGSFADARIGSIDARDIAACAAAVLLADPAQYNGKTFTITGSEALSKTELATVISSVVGKKVDYIEVGDANFYNALKPHVGDFAYPLIQLAQTYRLRMTNNPWVTGNVEILTGQKPRTWKAFVEEHKAAFQ